MKKKVSCHIITYNQENFIAQCIESVLMQKTDFDFEIIIGDDNSTDGTRDILREYEKQYPHIIKLNLRPQRGKGIPGKENFLTTLEMCHGEYVSFCDGDDYWVDPQKLQKQITFLELNKEYVIHSGNALCVSKYEVISNKSMIISATNETFTIENFFSSNQLINCTVVFRNSSIKFPAEFHSLTFGDWFLYVYLMKNSGLKTYRSREILSAYRVDFGGVMNSLTVQKNLKQQILQITTIRNYVGKKRFVSQDLDVLKSLFVKKIDVEIQDGQYFQAFKTGVHQFCIFKNLPLKHYLKSYKRKLNA